MKDLKRRVLLICAVILSMCIVLSGCKKKIKVIDNPAENSATGYKSETTEKNEDNQNESKKTEDIIKTEDTNKTEDTGKAEKDNNAEDINGSEVNNVPETGDESEASENAADASESEEKHVHEYMGEEIKKASCAETGTMLYTCSGCGETYEEIIPVLSEHIMDEGKVAAEPSCAIDGLRVYTCTICGKESEEIIPATGDHTWDDGKIAIEANCAKEGTLLYTCEVCSQTYKESIPKTEDHVLDEGSVIREPNCVREGVLQRYCSVCHGYFNEDIPKTNEHVWDVGKVTVEPTASKKGEWTYTCQVCDATKSEEIPYYNFHPEELKDSKHLKTSNNPDNYIDFCINGNTLEISGKLIYKNLEKIWIRVNDIGEPVYCSDGQEFHTKIDLTSFTGKVPVTVYCKTNNESLFWSFIWRTLNIEYKDNEYSFVLSSILDYNIGKLKHWLNPKLCLDEEPEESILKLAKEIVGSEKDQYKQMFLVHSWMSDNVYYDYDYYYNKTSSVFTSPGDVLKSKRSVCAGYASMQCALLRALGIPSTVVSTFSLGVSTSGDFSESGNASVTKSNHAHVEAYLEAEDRWVTMDSTWDSKNEYRDGTFIYKPVMGYLYFDITPDFLALDHKIITRTESDR